MRALQLLSSVTQPTRARRRHPFAADEGSVATAASVVARRVELGEQHAGEAEAA